MWALSREAGPVQASALACRRVRRPTGSRRATASVQRTARAGPEPRPPRDSRQQTHEREEGGARAMRTPSTAKGTSRWLRMENVGRLAGASGRRCAQPPATAGRIVTSSPSATGGVEAVEEADVLAADVDVDEAAQAAVLGDPLAQLVEAARRARRAPRRPSPPSTLGLGLAAGGGAQLRRDLDRDRHQAAHRARAARRAASNAVERRLDLVRLERAAHRVERLQALAGDARARRARRRRCRRARRASPASRWSRRRRSR